MPHLLDRELYQQLMALAACPTASCHEAHVRNCLVERLKDLPHVATWLDEFGNLHARYEHDPAGEREAFRVVAHMDHPAFVVQEGELRFAGGVDEKYFAGKRIVFHHEQTTRVLGRARVESIAFTEDAKRVFIDAKIPDGATFATWELPAARCTKKFFISPACDDLAQVSLVLALVRRLALGGAKARFHALFTRAEEIGFAGALASLKAETPLESMPTLSLETSKARGFAKVDAGPVVRVGDRLSVFDSRITHWLETGFREAGRGFQRLLMAGGACEASVFHRAGLPTGALCVALNHYHNMGPGTTVRAESISLRDIQGLYDGLFYLATQGKTIAETDQAVGKRFAQLEAKALAALG